VATTQVHRYDGHDDEGVCILLVHGVEVFTENMTGGIDRLEELAAMINAAAPAPTARPSQPTLLNGLTEQETTASASVAGLSGAQPERRLCPTENLWDANGQPKPDAWKRAAQPEAPAEPSRDEAIRVWHKYCSPFASRLGTIPASPVIDAMLEFATPAPAAQQPAEHRGIYVASRASEPARPAMWRALRDAGWPITSTWIDEAGEGQTADIGELWARIDHEVRSSAGLIVYAEADDFPLKGAYIEAGIALGAGLPVAVVMPGVALEPRSDRPMGSWVRHPLVTICETLEQARAILKAQGGSQ
jgi:hypothetical protein